MPHLDSQPSASPLRDDWYARLEQLILQHPLIVTHRSRLVLGSTRRRKAPHAVFVGIGLCGTSELSSGIPLDVLGMLIPAELVRRAVGAQKLIAMVADEHAVASGFDAFQVERRSRDWLQALWQVQQGLGLDAMEVVRASHFHETDQYQAILAQVSRKAPTTAHPYYKKEVADIAFVDRVYGGIVKVGWTIGGSRPARDEVGFDQRFRSWVSHDVGFLYCKPGRAYDDARPKASPYVLSDPSRRLCLAADEDPMAKLAHGLRHASPTTAQGVLRHLKAITRAVGEVAPALRGPVEQRVEQLHARIYGPRQKRSASAAAAARSQLGPYDVCGS